MQEIKDCDECDDDKRESVINIIIIIIYILLLFQFLQNFIFKNTMQITKF